jgi:hypothetical protein
LIRYSLEKISFLGCDNNAKRYSFCLGNADFSILKTFLDSKRTYIKKALSALAKFSGCYEFYNLIKAYGLK